MNDKTTQLAHLRDQISALGASSELKRVRSNPDIHKQFQSATERIVERLNVPSKGKSSPVERVTKFIRVLLGASEQVTHAIENICISTLGECVKHSEQSPVMSMRAPTSRRRVRVGVGSFIENQNHVSNSITAKWSAASLSIQEKETELRLLLQGEPEGCE